MKNGRECDISIIIFRIGIIMEEIMRCPGCGAEYLRKFRVNQDGLEQEQVSSIDLWIDGPEFDDTAGWKEELVFDFERFRYDDNYARLISDYIQQRLQHLATEVEQIAIMSPPDRCHF